MTLKTDYQNLVYGYTWTGNGAGATVIPNSPVVQVNGNYVFSYHYLLDQQDMLNTGYYQSFDKEYQNFEALTSSLNNAIHYAFQNASGYDYTYTTSFSDVAKIDFEFTTDPSATLIFAQNGTVPTGGVNKTPPTQKKCLPLKGFNYALAAAMAWFRSAIKSFASSIPIETRKPSGITFAISFWVSVNCECVVDAG